MSILQACESVNLVIPRFCYHERLSVAGNCRMCLVEIDKAPKLAASCAVPVMPNMVIHTNSLAVKKAREGVLEFLLLNHPLDCAICDQAGECDLQDQTMTFGSDRSRFHEFKRAVEDIHCSPLIKTIMTRCIHCTRCIRFANEVIGVPDLGTSGRGNNLAINLYIKKLFKSEFSGNLIDLCPVGALTSKPYTFIARPWELKSIESIDTFDGVGCNTRIDIRGYEIMRILPRLNDKINEEWISDKTRFAFDGLKRQRLYEPLLKQNGKFEAISWQEALTQIVLRLTSITNSYQIGANIGSQADLESIFLLKYLIEKKQGVFLNSERPAMNSIDFQSSYLFNSTINKLDEADLCLLLGVNPRLEGAIINLRLRKRYLSGNFKTACFGSALDLTFPVYNFGSTLKSLVRFLEGQHAFCEHFSRAKKPVVIVGKSFFQTLGEKQARLLFSILLKNTNLVKNKWKGLNFLNENASDSGKLELGVRTNMGNFPELKFLYCLGESNFVNVSKTNFVVYQGHQGNATAVLSNLILPSSSFVEKNSFFVNVEGRYQKTKAALLSPGKAKSDWSILFAIIEKYINAKPKKEGMSALKRQVSNFNDFTVNKHRLGVSKIYAKDFLIKSKIILKNSFLPATKLENFYRTDNISKISITMVKCSKTLLEKSPFFK
uniref:NADH dehydrogenase subunit 11 n=1 Tax=Chroomonas placoidea TaxID=173977 RepID=A0A2P1G805_9CRYP|nr:NADH dehydrogenase subunit 11 [Chroomonas placoidea]AVM81082.1 NADH dehydrogenase subunit 11 [Chroomonas placoidea]